MKPAAGIFETAIDISGFPAHTALFIDDKQENCDAAAALGIHSIRFESPAQLRRELTNYGIEVQ
jgi:putative hydrolase of the HAD superfamily